MGKYSRSFYQRVMPANKGIMGQKLIVIRLTLWR